MCSSTHAVLSKHTRTKTAGGSLLASGLLAGGLVHAGPGIGDAMVEAMKG